jgi:hypothetical protein
MSGHDESVKEAHEQAKGGSWRDEDLNLLEGWSGERGSSKKKEKSPVSHIPLTRSQEDSEILSRLNIKDEEMNALTRQIERRMLKNAGRNSTSVLASIIDENRDKEEKLKAWVAETSSHESTRHGNAIESLEREVTGLRDQIMTLQKQVDEMLTAQVERTDAETQMIQEAYSIIVSNLRAEADTAQTPSEVNRMEEHVETLKLRSQRLSSMVQSSPAIARQAQQSSKRKTKFGKL